MSAEVVKCPGCAGETRVPQELFGKAVQCPLCSVTYIAPTFADGIALTSARIDVSPPEVRRDRRFRREPGRDKNTNQSVGLAMILVGTISLLVNGFGVGNLLNDPDRAREVHIGMMKQFALALKQPEPTPEELEKSWQPELTLNLLLVASGASLCIVAGAICILTRKFYGLACFSTLVAMFNVSNFCCMIGLPIGIWTLVVLLNPDVKLLYRPERAIEPGPRPPTRGVGDL